MIDKARLKLTTLYSLIFLILFWTLSGGVYEWMNGHFGDRQKFDMYMHHQDYIRKMNRPEPPSDIVMDELRNTLIVLDLLLLLVLPLITWFLTGKTLKPVAKAYEREKQFFTDASHDLRTPLTILKGELDLALKKEQSVQTYKKTLKSNQEEVTRLIELVENMLFFAREPGSQQTIHKEIIDLTDIIVERISKFKTTAQQKQQKLLFHPAKESITITGNKQQIERLLTSLLDNAIKYTPAKGTVTVSLSHEKNSALIRVQDTGIGIAKEQQEQVFDRFFRSDSTRSEKGYGLGLSIAKQIVAFHEGKILLESKKEYGTTITIRLPQTTQTQGKNLS